ncbi:MAG: hypothetical protein AAFX09_02555 [Pseudomonadota bacterium]
MSENTRRGAAPLLPPDAGRDRPLFAVAAILVFLACLSALGALGAWRAAEGWTDQLSAEMTVQILPEAGRDADTDAADAVARVQAVPGVIAARAASREEAEALLQPWIGEAGLPEDFPAPRIIAVRLDPGAPAEVETVRAALGDAEYEALVDGHRMWTDAVERAAAAVRYFALTLVVVLTIAAGAVVAFAARASLAARWDVADALHLVGAPDQYVAELFQQRFLSLGLKAGFAGAACAGLAALILAYVGGQAGALFFLPTLKLGWGALLIPPAAALASGLVAAFAARRAVFTALARRWE